MTSQISDTVYQAAHQDAVLVDRSSLDILKFTGQTRLDLLHRMSTNSVNGLRSGEGAATVLTTDIARIIDRLILYASSDTVYCLTGENNANNIARYLMRFVFFNDDFHIEDLSADTAVFALYGPQSRARLTAAGFPDEELPLHHWRECQINGRTAYLHHTDPLNGDGFFVMCQMTDRDALWDHLVNQGLAVADEAAFDFLRIEAGMPRYGRELTLDYIPLEADLWDDVSFSKGCYTGQEIIARMESRGKLAKRLSKLQPETPIQPGDDILQDGKKVGVYTSVAEGPGGLVALGYVKTNV
ncbi:MAG TPA: glycine cleavage system protein T [Chloroflexota bacterium]|nr:glycine cleavage system protein T [Chloroflexota bacterium]HUM68330.1 glycine cleavage system protein T [Chloroflexota bacterium]